MTRLELGSDQTIEMPTSDDIATAIAALSSGAQSFVTIKQNDDEQAFVKVQRLQAGLFLLEYSDAYGHLAADEPVDDETLAEVLNVYTSGDTTWIKRFSWAPVEL